MALYRPKCRPDGDVVVDSRQCLNRDFRSVRDIFMGISGLSLLHSLSMVAMAWSCVVYLR